MSKRRRDGRLPTMVSAEALARLAEKSSSQLAAMRADLGSLMHAHGALVNKFRVEAEAITAVLHAREKPELEVSDHAVVRWLEKVKGFDMDALRREIAHTALEARRHGGGTICRAKGDAMAYTKNDITFIVARRNNIVTVVFGDYENPTTPKWPEVTPEQVAAIDKLVAPEFTTGDWVTVESEHQTK